MPDSNARREQDPRASDPDTIEAEIYHEVFRRRGAPVPIDDLLLGLTFPLHPQMSSRRSDLEEAVTRMYHHGLVDTLEEGRFVVLTKPARRAVELLHHAGGLPE